MSGTHPTLAQALVSGFTGALALTITNETARRFIPEAPRLDTLGRRALARSIEGLGGTPPRGRALELSALAGDLISNSLFFALVGAGKSRLPLARGLLLGTAAGIGAVVLAPVLGLGRSPRGVTPAGRAMTIGWYLIGGLAAAATFGLVGKIREESK